MTIKVQVKNCTKKIEKYVKFKRSKSFLIFKIFSKFLRLFKTLKNPIFEKKSKMYAEESVDIVKYSFHKVLQK